MSEVTFMDWGGIIAAVIAAVGAVWAARASRTSTELSQDIRELRATMIKHLENHN